MASIRDVAELRRYKEFCDPYHELKSFLADAKRTDKLLMVWDGYQKHDESYFEYDQGFANLKEFLCVMCKDISKLSKPICSSGDEGHACNWFSMLNDIYKAKKLALHGESKCFLERLAKRVDNKTGHDVHKVNEKYVYDAEIAFLFYQLGPKFYNKAVNKYTNIMKWLVSKVGDLEEDFSLEKFSLSPTLLNNIWSCFDTDDPMRKKFILWCFMCGTLFSKLLQKTNIHILRSRLKDIEISETKMVNTVFKNIREMLVFVTKTGDAQFSGRAWAIMADTMKMYELIGPRSDRTCKLPEKMSVDECMRKAVELSPDNPHVLFIVGRHFRQKATTLQHFKDAVIYLEKAGEQCPSMHVVFHHLGLAYRSMWILDRHYREVQLYVNAERKGRQGKPTGRRSKNNHKMDKKTSSQSSKFGPAKYSELAAAGQTYATGEPKGGLCEDLTNDNDTEATKSELASGECSRELPTVPEFSSKAIHSKYSNNSIMCDVPNQYKTPYYYDILRTNNPIEKQLSDHEYLKKSYTNLLEAHRKVSETSPRYLIDLARICISMGKDCQQYFVQADTLLGDAQQDDIAVDAAYLHEQWGLYTKNNCICQRNVPCHCLENAKMQLLKSLKYSVVAKQRSKVAFYKLLEIVDQMANGADAETAIVKQKFFIYTVAEQYTKALESVRDTGDQLSSILKKPENCDLLWGVIECCHRSREETFNSAFEYLSLYTRCWTTDKPPPKQASVAIRVATEMLHVNNDRSPDRTFKNIFRWVFSDQNDTEEEYEEIDEEYTMEDAADEESEYVEEENGEEEEDIPFDKIDILLLSPYLESPVITNIQNTLRKYLNIFTNEDLILLNHHKQQSHSILCNNLHQVRICLLDVDCTEREHDDLCKDIKDNARGFKGKCVIYFSVTQRLPPEYKKNPCCVEPLMLSDENMKERDLVTTLMDKAIAVLWSKWDRNDHVYRREESSGTD